MFWGFSEAIDLYEEYAKYVKNSEDESTEVNILLFGSSDPRHIIKSIARSYTHKVKVHFFVLEGCPALIARQMILLSIALEGADVLTLPTRTHLFMDIYGNSLIRSTSFGYINSKAKHFIKCVTDLDFNEQMQPIFDFSYLKFIERDFLENVFSFWRENGTKQFDISKCWMERIRQSLKERFDSRQGIYDWHLQMRLKENGAHQICTQEYNHWRETGVAFTFPEYRQSHANKTFATQSSNGVHANEYVGDITVGPFCTFGLSCSDQNLLKSNYGQNEYRATDISERNIFELLYEIQEQHQPDLAAFSLHRLGATKIDVGKTISSEAEFFETDLRNFNKPLIATNRVRVSFLSINDAQFLTDGKKFRKHFDVVFVGRIYFPLLKEDFSEVFKPGALVLFETGQLSVDRKPEIADSIKKIREFARSLNLQPISHFNINVALPIAKFVSLNCETLVG